VCLTSKVSIFHTSPISSTSFIVTLRLVSPRFHVIGSVPSGENLLFHPSP
jgi:hypothetical protein